MRRINIRNKGEVSRLNKLRKGTSIQIRAAPDFIETLHLFNEKITKGNKLAQIRPLTMSEITTALSPLVRERIINDKDIKANIKKARDKRKMKYYLELEGL